MSNRILLVCHGYPFETIGGVGQVIEQLVTHLPRFGWEVHVLVPSTSTNSLSRQISVSSTSETWGTLHQLHRPIRKWSQSWKDEKANEQLFQWLKELNPNVVHIHHLNALPWEWILRGKEALDCYLWLTLHDYAIPCARGQLLDRYLQLCEGPISDQCTNCIHPWLTLDGWRREGLRLVHRPDKTVSERIDLTRRLVKSMDWIDAPSEHMTERFTKLYPSIRIQHCHLPIAAAKPGELQTTLIIDEHRFLFVGSIHPSKGLHILLRSFTRLQKKHPRIRLTIIGHDSPSDVVANYAQIWKDFAEANSNIDWMGQIPHQEVLNQMSRHHTLVLPSVWNENSPIVVREAIQRGLHVICGRGGSSELSPTILDVEPLSVLHLMNRMNEVVGQPRPSRKTYPPADKTIAEWVQTATQTKRKAH